MPSADPKHVQDFLLVTLALLGGLGVLAGIIFGVMNAARRRESQLREVHPQPLEVIGAEKGVSETECDLRHDGMDQRVGKVERDVELLRTELKADRISIENLIRAETGKIHSRVDDVLEAVSEMRGKVL